MDRVVGCLPCLDVATIWAVQVGPQAVLPNWDLGRAAGWALWLGRPLGLFHCWEKLWAGFSGQEGPLAVPSSWVGLVTLLWG